MTAAGYLSPKQPALLVLSFASSQLSSQELNEGNPQLSGSSYSLPCIFFCSLLHTGTAPCRISGMMPGGLAMTTTKQKPASCAYSMNLCPKSIYGRQE